MGTKTRFFYDLFRDYKVPDGRHKTEQEAKVHCICVSYAGPTGDLLSVVSFDV